MFFTPVLGIVFISFRDHFGSKNESKSEVKSDKKHNTGVSCLQCSPTPRFLRPKWPPRPPIWEPWASKMIPRAPFWGPWAPKITPRTPFWGSWDSEAPTRGSQGFHSEGPEPLKCVKELPRTPSWELLSPFQEKDPPGHQIISKKTSKPLQTCIFLPFREKDHPGHQIIPKNKQTAAAQSLCIGSFYHISSKKQTTQHKRTE